MSQWIESSSSRSPVSETETGEGIANGTQRAQSDKSSWMIIVASSFPVFICLALTIVFTVRYRRRQLTLQLKPRGHCSRFSCCLLNISFSSIRSRRCSKKEEHRCHQPFLLPRTETIVYNYHQLSAPSTPTVNHLPDEDKSPRQGQTNAVFDATLPESKEHATSPSPFRQPLIVEQHRTSLEPEFPASSQEPVRAVTPCLLKAVAHHRLSLLDDRTGETATLHHLASAHRQSTTSLSSTSSSPQRVILFSQRTNF